MDTYQFIALHDNIHNQLRETTTVENLHKIHYSTLDNLFVFTATDSPKPKLTSTRLNQTRSKCLHSTHMKSLRLKKTTPLSELDTKERNSQQ